MQASLPEPLLVALATYNERDNLAPLLAELRHYLPATAEILVIDDASPDGTGQLADQLARDDARLHVRHRGGKLGLGTALLEAVRFACDREFALLLTLDSDFSHPPRYVPALLAGMDRFDVMIGSRYVPGGGTTPRPATRRLLSLGANTLARTLLHTPVRDATGNFRCYRCAILKKLPLGRVRSQGYSFLPEVLARCVRAGARIGETPITFEDRRAGQSKADWREVLRSLSALIWVAVER